MERLTQAAMTAAPAVHIAEEGCIEGYCTKWKITMGVHSNMDNPIFRFMDMKRAEGKHFYVYTVAGATKFLRIYYAKVKEYLSAKEATA